MPQPRVLVLEDDANLGFILQEHLEMNGFSVLWVRDGVEATTAHEREKFLICLVDVMTPKKNGFAFVRGLRKTDGDTPVIFLTAKSLKEDRIEGFKLGCDDYVTKPFSMEELLLRIAAVLRRSAGGPANPPRSRYEIGACLFDADKQTLQTPAENFELTPKESELLKLLCLHANRTLERETALMSVWGDDSYFNARSMDVFISRLRKRLASDQTVAIVNIHGKGYKLTVEAVEGE